MKTEFINTSKMILADRLMTVIMIVFILLCATYCIYIGVSLHPSDLQVAVHYSVYGQTNFYRDKWYYLMTFIVFGVLLALVHTTLTAKIYSQGRRQMALLFMGLSFLILTIAWFVTWSILKIAFL
jgi:hypothetical protein